ncbi:MAG: sigma-70 family RNA polymerase sigma factor [Planctomycetes bacterium]|nr:sigma-70 family RNA polymerase sigma factor [Planctomycetota bacterium]
MASTTAAHHVLKGMSLSAQGRVPEHFWEIVERYRAELINQGVAILGDQAEAEDAVQETFCKAFQKSGQLAEIQSLGAWLRTINRANALDRRRGRRREADGADRQARELPRKHATTGGFNLLELREVVARAIESLSDAHRTVVVLHFWEQLTCEQIAERLAAPAGTVKWRLYEAELKLHAKLKTYLGETHTQDASCSGRKRDEA